jgi:hypothetical protein
VSAEAAAGLGDAELATGKGPKASDGLSRAKVAGSLRLEHLQHSLRTVRRPHSDDPAVSLAQCLR